MTDEGNQSSGMGTGLVVGILVVVLVVIVLVILMPRLGGGGGDSTAPTENTIIDVPDTIDVNVEGIPADITE